MGYYVNNRTAIHCHRFKPTAMNGKFVIEKL